MVKIRELSLNERAAIKYLREAGLSYAQIAQQVGCSKSAVFKIYKTFENTGSIGKRRRSGRPKKSSDRAERAICRAARKLRFSTLRDIKQDVSDICNLSNNSIRGALHKYGLFNQRRKAKPLVSIKNRMKRQRWANSLMEWPVSHWEDVIFSDECRFSLLNDSGVQRVWRTKREANNPMFFCPKVSNSLSVMVWGCVGPNGAGRLVVCEQCLDSNYYIEILKKNLKASVEMIHGHPSHPFIFQQDNAPCHSSQKTIKYLHDENILLLPWPAQSPDINIIENLWQFMKNALRHDPPRTKDQLIKNLFQIWYAIPRSVINKLYNSLPHRMKAITKCKGYPTKY